MNVRVWVGLEGESKIEERWLPLPFFSHGTPLRERSGVERRKMSDLGTG